MERPFFRNSKSVPWEIFEESGSFIVRFMDKSPPQRTKNAQTIYFSLIESISIQIRKGAKTILLIKQAPGIYHTINPPHPPTKSPFQFTATQGNAECHACLNSYRGVYVCLSWINIRSRILATSYSPSTGFAFLRYRQTSRVLISIPPR